MKEETETTLKQCPKCGSEFRCQGDSDCWCENVRLHRRQMWQILQEYTDCLCPECLKSYEED